MKKVSIISLATAIVLLGGCGSGSTSSESTQTDTTQSGTVISVERGPIIGATVIDAAGNVATELTNGKYQFDTSPTYPVLATGGVIDLDRDGQVSVGDVVNDVNLTTTQGDVVTLLTTLASDPQTKSALQTIVSDLNLSENDIFSKTPSESIEVEAVSNAIYRYIKESNLSDVREMSAEEIASVNVHAEYTRYIEDENHDVAREEISLVESLVGGDAHVETIDNEAELSTVESQLENEPDETEIENLTTHLQTLQSEYERVEGDINYEDEGSDVRHYQGVACATCHSISGTAARSIFSRDYDNEEDDNEVEADNESENEAVSNNEGNPEVQGEYESSEESGESEESENSFDSGATIYTVLNGSDSNAAQAASGYTLRLVLSDGSIENYIAGRGTGNVHASFNAGIATYTAEVLDRDGNVVNSSASNSHDASRFDCNSCHTAAGSNGAPGRIVSFRYLAPVITEDTNTTTTLPAVDGNTTTVTPPADTNTSTVVVTPPTDTNQTTLPATAPAISFANDVLPLLDTNCKSCHGGSGNFSITASATPYAGVIPFVDTANPDNSSLLQKGSGSVGHGGGTVILSTSSAYVTVRDWIAQGALNN